jgi:hypothetical protein
LKVPVLKEESDEPMLAERSWDVLFRDILSSDFPDGNDVFRMESEGPGGVAIHNVEEGIEWWAMQSMPAVIDPLLDSQESIVEPIPSDFTVDGPIIVCYGMVS